ncbi:MAG: ABC transporter ATP-binding protein, partial [Blastocatellia bacterium]|nr:ABC transporter ATP-binding protein [Blastocatellia bacterium]
MASEHHEEEQLGKLYDTKAARRLLRYLGPYRHLVVLALFLTICVNLVRQLGPLLTKWAIDDYVTPAAVRTMPFNDAFRGITLLAVVYLASLLVTLLIGYFQDVLLNTIGQRVMFDLRDQIFSKLQTVELAYYDKNPVGRLITRLTTDVDSLNELFTS